MEKSTPISVLENGIVKEMERLNYASETIRIFRLDSRKFRDFISESDLAEFFTEEIGERYLREKYGHTPSNGEKLSPEAIRAIRCVRRMGEYDLYGGFSLLSKNAKPPVSEWALDDESFVDAYNNSLQSADNSEATKETRLFVVRRFYEFLAVNSIKGINYLSAQVLSDYIHSLTGFAPVTRQRRLASMRSYFRFLHRNGYCEHDWAHYVPNIRRPENLNIPALWESEEVDAMLKSIDRGSPVGKRDYAILLLVIQLGLRIYDISELRLSSLRWERNEIEIVQHKNSKKLVLPLLEDLGWAIIDYIRYARPKVDDPYVFLTLNAPYRKMASHTVGDVVRRVMGKAGIAKRPRIVSGMHSLRHALARRLLKQGTPLPQVADILGHTSYSSTAPYLRVDIDGLRECCLSLEGVASDE